MNPMTSTWIERALRAVIQSNYLASGVADRFAEALDDTFHIALEARERRDRIAPMRAEQAQLGL